jgi:alginate O-acetyltransferase complex protein AlgJ
VDLLHAMRLISLVDGRPPYHQLDTHWDDRGVIMMVREIAEHIQPGISAGWTIRPEGTVENPADLPLLLGRTGNNNATVFSLAPVGDRDRTRQAVGDLKTPIRFESAPSAGMVTASIGMLADSFSLPATRYLPAVFSDVEVVFYSSLTTNRSDVLRVLVESDVVLLEVVERNLASGIAPVVDPSMVDAIAAELTKHPRG